MKEKLKELEIKVMRLQDRVTDLEETEEFRMKKEIIDYEPDNYRKKGIDWINILEFWIYVSPMFVMVLYILSFLKP